MEAND